MGWIQEGFENGGGLNENPQVRVTETRPIPDNLWAWMQTQGEKSLLCCIFYDGQNWDQKGAHKFGREDFSLVYIVREQYFSANDRATFAITCNAPGWKINGSYAYAVDYGTAKPEWFDKLENLFDVNPFNK